MTFLEYYLNEDNPQDFFTRNGIDQESLSYAGKGDFGTAYYTEDGRIVKNTTSESEYILSKQQMEEKRSRLCTIYDVDAPTKGTYYILMEELSIPSSIESKWDDLMSCYETQGIGIDEGLMYFDWNQWTEETGDDPDDSLINFESALRSVYRDYSEVARLPDLKVDNLGYDKNKVLKTFDLHDKSFKSGKDY